MSQDVAVTSWTYKVLEPNPLKPAVRLPIKLKASSTYAMGQVLGPVTASPGVYGIYASGNSDGTQLAECILNRAAVTDASGNITWVNTAGQTVGEFGETWPNADAYFGGLFNAADIAGLESNAVTVLKGRLLKASNYFMFG